MRVALPRSGIVRVGLGLLGLLFVVALAAPLLAPYEPLDRVGRPFARPSGDHLLGTDDVGHDLLSALIFGTRISLVVGVAAAASATVVGVVIGSVAGYARGRVDAVLMRVVDIALALPLLPLVLVVGVFLGPGLVTEVLVISTVLWAAPARELRAQVLSTRELDHVLSARSMGAGGAHVLLRHVLPEVAPLLAPQFVFAVRTAILLEAALSFLGLGDTTAQSWGTMLAFAQARSAFLTDAWLWWVVPPGLAIAAAVLGFAFVGFGLEERSRPQLHRRRRGGGSPVAVTSVGVTPTSEAAGDRALVVEGLTVEYGVGDERLVAVRDVSLAVAAGETVGLVGESGSGKTSLVMAAAGLLRPPARVTAGRALLCGQDLGRLSAAGLRLIHGDRVALVPQQAMDALNPVFRVGDQIAEAITLHRPVGRAAARHRARELLEGVGVEARWAAHYPHELSGGMRQRAVIAMALANEPDLLIADEPTTGLDVVVAAEILDLLAELRDAHDMAMLVVSHDVAAVLRLADRLVVMRDGEVVEDGPAAVVATAPAHAYTRSLLEAVPRLRMAAGPQ